MKPLLPSLREKKRYLVYEVVSKDNVSKLEVEKSIIGSCLQFLGELNLGKAGVISVGEVYKNNKGVLKVATRYVDEIITHPSYNGWSLDSDYALLHLTQAI